MLSSAGPWPRQNFCLGCFIPSLHLGTVCARFQQSDQTNCTQESMLAFCSWSRSSQVPRARHSPVSALLSLFCCVFTCPRAPWGQRPCLIHVFIPPAKPLCSINVWWTTERKNVHHQKIAHQSPVHQLCQEMFSSDVVSEWRSLQCLSSARSTGNSEGLCRG